MNSLSKKALDMLEYNGYSCKLAADKVIFRKGHDYIGIMVFAFLFILILPILFSINIVIALLGLLLFIGGASVYKKYFSKSSSLIIDLSLNKINFKSAQLSRHFLIRRVRNVFLHSRFKNEYSSAFKSTNKEYTVTLGLQLENDFVLNLFYFISDHQEPSKEMKEVAAFLESSFKSRNKTA